MMHFRNKSGFTLIEVLIAVAIIGVAIMPIYSIQTALLARVSKYTGAFVRTLYAKSFLNGSQLSLQAGKELKKEKKVPGPSMKLIFERAPIPSGSTVKRFKDLVLDRVTVEWQEGNVKRKEQFVTFTYKPQEQQQSNQGAQK